MMLLQSKQIAIIGAGPGGLTLARLLQLRGVNVKVYERDLNKDARLQGAPLDMHQDSGWAALCKANLQEKFKQNIREGADLKIIVNERAEIMFSDHEYKPVENLSAKATRPEIDRGALRRLFLDALEFGSVVWDSHFVTMEKQHQGWLLHFKNNSSAYADVVVAADGANSKIRPYVTDIKAFYSGVTMVEINIDDAAKVTPHIYTLLNGGKIMAFGKGKNILGGQKNTGGLGFYASFKTDENWAADSGLDFSDKAQMLAWFKEEYKEWDSIWYDLFKNAAMPLVPRPIYCMPLDQTWEALPNVTLLGDAAHVMPPFAGEGANTSMFDALELSECLTSDQHHTLQEAISFYEVSMRKRAAIAAEKSLKNGEWMHSQGALEKILGMYGFR